MGTSVLCLRPPRSLRQSSLTSSCRSSPHAHAASLHVPAKRPEVPANRLVRTDHIRGWFRRNPDPHLALTSSSLDHAAQGGASTVGTKVNSDFVRNVAVSQPSGLGGVNRNAPNDVYG